MTYRNIEYYNSNGIALSSSNLCTRTVSIVDIYDAIEDARDGRDLAARLNRLDLPVKIQFGRESAIRTSLKALDCFGNINYLEVFK